jgi:hypothetical protein
MNALEIGLKRPFLESEVKHRKGAGNKMLAYLTARTNIKRLDEIVGMGNWSDEYDYIGGRMICKLSLRHPQLAGSEWITKCDGADDSQIEGAKGGISDSFKRACVKFGLGLYLYHPESYVNGVPAIWATPEGYDAVMAARYEMSVEQWKAEYSKALKL